MKTTKYLAMMIAIAISAAASVDTFAQRNNDKGHSRKTTRVERHDNNRGHKDFKGDKGHVKPGKPDFNKPGKPHKPDIHKPNQAHKPGKPHYKPHASKPHAHLGSHAPMLYRKPIHVKHHNCCDYSHWRKHRPVRGTVVHHIPDNHTVVIRDGRPFYSVLGVLLTRMLIDGVVSYVVVD